MRRIAFLEVTWPSPRYFLLPMIVLTVSDAFAVRPFITDDARVVGYRLGQWENWLRFDRFSGQHWHMLAYGPTRYSELTFGAVYGYERTHPEMRAEGSYAMPLLQGKFLFREYGHKKPPGIALVAGTFLPGGQGALVPPGYGAFAFSTISQCFGEKEDLLIHLNFGGNYLYLDKQNDFVKTWGLGTQIRALGGFHIVGELFSGDPYIPGAGLSYQCGFRHFFNDLVQIDATLGEGLAGENKLPFWFSVGLRVVTTRFERKNIPVQGGSAYRPHRT